MDFLELAKKRTSTRSFSNKVLEREKLEQILASGRVAPSAKNLQPTKIYVIKSAENIKKVDEVTPCRYNAPVCLLVCSDKDTAWNSKVEKGYSTYEMDASIVATHLILAAASLDVDSLWVRNFTREDVSLKFNLPKNIIPICFILLGYKDENNKENPTHSIRKSLEEIVKYI